MLCKNKLEDILQKVRIDIKIYGDPKKHIQQTIFVWCIFELFLKAKYFCGFINVGHIVLYTIHWLLQVYLFCSVFEENNNISSVLLKMHSQRNLFYS